MATDPAFASAAVKTGCAVVPGTADLSLTAPANVTGDIIAAGASGTKIERVRIVPVATIGAGGGLVNLFVYTGSVYHLFDGYFVPSVSMGATAEGPNGYLWYAEQPYVDFVIPTGWSIRATCTAAVLQSNVKVFVFGGDN